MLGFSVLSETQTGAGSPGPNGSPGVSTLPGATSGDGGESRASTAARLGVASLPDQKTIHTPSLLVYTGKGCSPNVTWDGLERISEEIRALDPEMSPSALVCQLDVLQLIHQQSNIRDFRASLPSGRPFLGVPEKSILVATPRNPTAYEHVGMTRLSTDERASCMTSQGAAWTSPEDYLEIACGVGADIVVALGDEAVSDSRTNRVIESSKRTILWMQRALQWLDAHKQAPFLMCPIVGGGSIEKRRDAITYMTYINDPRVHGVYVSGLATGDSAGTRQDILREVVARVPREKLRMVSGISNPIEVLDAVRCGIDLFDTSYVSLATRAGLALCFPTDDVGSFKRMDASVAERHRADQEYAFDHVGFDGMKINLWSDAYKLDRSPMVQDCRCASCREHTRGYVHHLLVTHEMTANVLLEQHNIFHMLRFFAGIRRALHEGQFEQYYLAFIEYVQRWQRG